MENLFTFLFKEFSNMNLTYKIRFYISFVILIIGCSLSGIVQIIFKNILQTLSGTVPIAYFSMIGFALFYSIFWTINQITNMVVWLMTQKCIIEFSKKIIIQSFAHVLAIPYHILILENNKTILTYLENIFTALQIIISSFVIHILPALIEMMIAFFFFAFLYGILYSALLLLLIAIFFYLIYYFIYQNEPIEKEYHNAYDIFKEHMNHALIHIEIIKTYHANRYECQTLYTALKSFFDTSYKRNMQLDRVQIYHIILCGIILFLFTSISYYQYTKNIITIADFILINNYFLQFSIPMTFLGYIFSDLYKNIVILKQAYKVFSFPQDQKILLQKIKNSSANYDIILKAVSISIREQTLLSDITFTILQGQKIALVGKSGSGKSTLLKLLCGLLQPTSGSITIGDINLSTMPFSQISSLITIIPQQSYLFLGTLRDNIVYNNESVSEEDIINSLKDIGLFEKINSLENGLDTDIRNINFSGGEKQRLSIARGILRKTPIFFLDEVTAALDTHNELLVNNYLDQSLSNKTIITITHKMQDMEKFDSIIVINDGKLVGHGIHSILLQSNNIYQELYNNGQ